MARALKYKVEPIAQRFFKKVNKNGSLILNTRCWEWTAKSKVNGYGRFSMHRKSFLAHRVSFFIKSGNFPEKCLLHKCDNRKCVNTKHLYVGDRKQNALDCVARGRHPKASITHCIRGHEFSKENTRMYKTHRVCKKCCTFHRVKELKRRRDRDGEV